MASKASVVYLVMTAPQDIMGFQGHLASQVLLALVETWEFLAPKAQLEFLVFLVCLAGTGDKV
ncbi:hypothetical protein INR49_021916 [Caranx melampygus]|nr:hypothetical protein INR49_021916 [Caranx melampygus]